MRCSRDDDLPRENLPFIVSIEDRDDTLLHSHEQWIWANGRGWYARDAELSLRPSPFSNQLDWIYRFSDADTAFWFQVRFA